MTFETALRARLKVSDGLTGQSIEWVKRPEGKYPAVVLTMVSLALGRHMTGFDPRQRARVQIDVFAMDAPTKTTLRDAVLSAIAPAVSRDGTRFGRAQEVSIRDASEQTDTDFIHRDLIEAVIPFMTES